MEALLGILAALGVIAALIFKRKSEKSDVNAILGETKGQDKQLEMSQQELDEAIQAIDESLAKLDAERAAKEKKDNFDNLSLKERADRIKKGLK